MLGQIQPEAVTRSAGEAKGWRHHGHPLPSAQLWQDSVSPFSLGGENWSQCAWCNKPLCFSNSTVSTKRASCFQINVSCKCSATLYHRPFFAGLRECSCPTSNWWFEGAHLGFTQLIKIWGLHTLQLILAGLQSQILNPLFHDISNYFRDFLQLFQSLQSQIGDALISNLHPSQNLPFSFCLSILVLGHSLCSSCICRIHTRALLNSFQECSEVQGFVRKIPGF